MHLVEQTEERALDRNEALLTVKEVAAILSIPNKKVYGLPIPRVSLSARRVRFLDSDLRAFIRRRRVA